MVEKTSVTHPIEVAVIDTPGCTGKLGITICPGKKGNSSFGGEWNRDLNQDISAIKNDFNPDLIVMLMPEPDIDKAGLNLSEIDRSIKGHAIEWIHLPLNSPEKPDENFDSVWMEHCDRILTILRDGGNVLLICRGGLGRSATIAARILMERGLSGRGAIYKVREARPGAIENKSQEEQVLSYNNFYPVIDGNHLWNWQKITGQFLSTLYQMCKCKDPHILKTDLSKMIIDSDGNACGQGNSWPQGSDHSDPFWAIISLLSRDGGLKDAGMILLSPEHMRPVDPDIFRDIWSQLFIDFEECFGRIGISLDQMVKIFKPDSLVEPFPTRLHQISAKTQGGLDDRSFVDGITYEWKPWCQLNRNDRTVVRKGHYEVFRAIQDYYYRVKAGLDDLQSRGFRNFKESYSDWGDEYLNNYLFRDAPWILCRGLLDWPPNDKPDYSQYEERR